MSKIKNFLTSTKAKVTAFATSAAITASLAISGVSADVTVDAQTATNKAKDIADILTYIFPLMGAFFAISGVIKWIMAFRSEQPEQQASAVKEIIIGVVCIIFRSFLWTPLSSVIFG